MLLRLTLFFSTLCVLAAAGLALAGQRHLALLIGAPAGLVLLLCAIHRTNVAATRLPHWARRTKMTHWYGGD
jgi:hypothetical protein